MNPNRWIADFDSSTAMLRAVASTLHGRDLPMLGTHSATTERALRPISRVFDRLPERLRDGIYIRAGALEAVSERTLSTIDAEAIARWTTEMYPARQVPAVAIGSSNGALTHLWSALGTPWLPQTVLIPVRRDAVDVDDIAADFAWGRSAAPTLLRPNPEIVLHQMIDPVQDRLMVHRMAYFRAKRTSLGAAYARFLQERLAPGGTIFIVDCRLSWGTTAAGERHFFQHGAVGGPTEDEYRFGGPRVARYLEEQRSTRRAWTPPRADGRTPEAEWRYDERMTADLMRLAHDAGRGWRVRRLRFTEPEDVSPLVADLFTWWNERRGVATRRALVSSFILLDPTLELRAGVVPFWMTFNTDGSAANAERYFDDRAPFERIDMTLFSHGVRSIGVVPLERWAALRARATKGGQLFGVDPSAFPKDFGNFMRYHADLARGLAPFARLPASLSLDHLDEFLSANMQRYLKVLVEDLQVSDELVARRAAS
jgi:hypothetical protein